MLAKNGYLDLEEVLDIPGFPGKETLDRKKCVVIECQQNIPCNPCEAACPHHAITVGEPITNLPVIDKEKCVGCGLCVAKCPGQAIFLVDQSAEDYDTVTLPYEYYPLPEKDQEVYGLSRAGVLLTKATVLRVIMTKANDRTAVVEVKVPKGYGMEVRNISTDGRRIASSDEPEMASKELLAEIDENQMYVCRCEEITKEEVIEAVRNGATSVNEVKRLLRAGMGLCQGRNCAKTIERIIAQELKVSPANVPQATKRGPVRPIKLTNYTSLEIEADEDFFEHDW
ncbi:MAG: (2Fe-2S)-binding protein [Lachnospiraceae bacterium]|nr:(2Fe-2S)-binding protein [Lachnospiraceae bacterium]